MTRSEHILATSRAVHGDGLYFREFAILTAIASGISNRLEICEATGIEGDELRHIIHRSKNMDREGHRVFLTLKGKDTMTRIHKAMNQTPA